MSLLNALPSSTEFAPETDYTGSGLLESGVYNCTIKNAYLTKAASGAAAVNFEFKTEDNRDYKETIYFTSGTAKGGKTYYEKDGTRYPLPGFSTFSSVSLLASGKEINQLATEELVHNIWNSEVRAEVPTKAETLVDLIGQPITLGIVKQTVDKRALTAAGTYEPTGETRQENQINKVFRASDHMTTAEIAAQAAEAKYVKTWKEKFDGVTLDKAKGEAGPNAGNLAKPASTPSTTKRPTQSLFASAD